MSERSGSSNLMKDKKTDHELQSCLGQGTSKEGKDINSVENGHHRTIMGEENTFSIFFQSIL